jgi:hypothetical protein
MTSYKKKMCENEMKLLKKKMEERDQKKELAEIEKEIFKLDSERLDRELALKEKKELLKSSSSTVSTPPPSQNLGRQNPGATSGRQNLGPPRSRQNLGPPRGFDPRTHRMTPPEKYNPRDWDTFLGEMILARLARGDPKAFSTWCMPCKSWESSGNCSYGNTCLFSHRLAGAKQGRQPCSHFLEGTCTHEATCWWVHPKTRDGAPVVYDSQVFDSQEYDAQEEDEHEDDAQEADSLAVSSGYRSA